MKRQEGQGGPRQRGAPTSPRALPFLSLAENTFAQQRSPHSLSLLLVDCTISGQQKRHLLVYSLGTGQSSLSDASRSITSDAQ